MKVNYRIRGMNTIRTLIVASLFGIAIVVSGFHAGYALAQPAWVSNPTGGRVLGNPKIYNLFMSYSWDADNPEAISKANIEAFTQALVDSNYLAWAAQYGVGSASYTGWHDANGRALVCPVPIAFGVTDFLSISAWVQCMTAPGPLPVLLDTVTGVPAPDNDTLYVVYVPSGTQIWDGPISTCEDYTAYHFMTEQLVWQWGCDLWNWECAADWCSPVCCAWVPYCGPTLKTQTFAYAVVPADCSEGSFDNLSYAATHEILEGATDPIIPTGWIDWNTLAFNADLVKKGEAADICESIGAVPTNPVRMTNGVLVAPYWSNADLACVPFPPVYPKCKDVTVSAGLSCTAYASIDDGSYGSGYSVTLSQDPSGPYSPGSTTVTLTVTNAPGASDQCSATVTVVDNTPPSIAAPPPVTVSTGPGATTCEVVVSNAVIGNVTVGDNCPWVISISQSGVPAGNVFPVGNSKISYTATDTHGNIATATQSVTVIDNAPPSISAPANVTVYTGPGAILCGTVVGDAALGTATATDNCPGMTVTRSGVPSGNLFPVGTSTLTYTAKDAAGNLVTPTQTVTVIDNTPPTISGASTSRSILWPPNHEMVNVTVNYPVSDNCSQTPACTLSIVSNEPINGTDDGNTSPDWVIVDAHHVKLRAERAGNGNGRVYTVTITCVDAFGNPSSQAVTVTVPYDLTK